VAALSLINDVEEVVFSTLHTNQPVSAGRPVAGTRIIPLATREVNITAVERDLPSGPVSGIRSSLPSPFGRHCDDRLRSVFRRIEDRFGLCSKPNFPNWAAA